MLSSRIRFAAKLVPLAFLALPGCFTAPTPSDLRCTTSEHCPSGYVCVTPSGTCQPVTAVNRDASPDLVLPGVDTASDIMQLEASPIEAGLDSSDGAAQVLDGSTGGDLGSDLADVPIVLPDGAPATPETLPDLSPDLPRSSDLATDPAVVAQPDVASDPPTGDEPVADVAPDLGRDRVPDLGRDSAPDLGPDSAPDLAIVPDVHVCQPTTRDCASSLDNDCNGVPDNQETAFCTCTVDSTRPCESHPGLDGQGQCKAGSQTCVASSDHQTSAWGGCSGSVGPAVESCFNGIDDDCNGQADCADSSCTAIATCVEDAPGFELGTVVGSAASCPTRYTAQTTTLGQGSIVPGTCSGCSCTGTMSCTGTFIDTGTAATSCSGNTIKGTYTSNTSGTSCTVFSSPMLLGENFKLTLSSTPGCNCTGSPALSLSSFPTSSNFCKASNVGGGCGTGRVCVPSSTTKHCAMATGGTACTGNYAAEGTGAWFTSINDSRSCGASCTSTAPAGGSCGKSILYLNSTACAVTPWYEVDTPYGGGCFTQDGPVVAASFKQAATPPTCDVSNTPTGPAPTGSGAKSICCL